MCCTLRTTWRNVSRHYLAAMEILKSIEGRYQWDTSHSDIRIATPWDHTVQRLRNCHWWRSSNEACYWAEQIIICIRSCPTGKLTIIQQQDAKSHAILGKLYHKISHDIIPFLTLPTWCLKFPLRYAVMLQYKKRGGGLIGNLDVTLIFHSLW